MITEDGFPLHSVLRKPPHQRPLIFPEPRSSQPSKNPIIQSPSQQLLGQNTLPMPQLPLMLPIQPIHPALPARHATAVRLLVRMGRDTRVTAVGVVQARHALLRRDGFEVRLVLGVAGDFAAGAVGLLFLGAGGLVRFYCALRASAGGFGGRDAAGVCAGEEW